MRTLTKSDRRQLARILGNAHEAELASALESVEEALREWRGGAILPSAVSERIHQFHRKSQEIYKMYNSGEPVIALVHAVNGAFVAEEQLPESLREVVLTIRGAIDSSGEV